MNHFEALREELESAEADCSNMFHTLHEALDDAQRKSESSLLFAHMDTFESLSPDSQMRIIDMINAWAEKGA